MHEFEAPADGEWHKLPLKPVAQIEAPTFWVDIDITVGGTGMVRNRAPAPITVSYRLTGESNG